MRQSGFLAAAALYALQYQRDRLAEDHAHAQLIADAVRSTERLSLLYKFVDTNIVIVRLDESLGSAAEFVQKLASMGVAALAFGPQSVRLVTHLDVNSDEVNEACRILVDLASKNLACSS